MSNRMKTVIAALGVTAGLAALPASAQVLGVDRAGGYGAANGYHEDGTLNVLGAHIDPRGARSGGLLGGVGNVVGGVVGGVTGAADDVVTGAIGARPARADIDEGYDRPVGGRSGYGRPSF